MKELSGTRRRFLSSTATAMASFALNSPGLWAAEEVDVRVKGIVDRTFGIDTHNHIDVPLTSEESPGPDIDLASELKQSGLAAICMTFATDYQQGDAYARFVAGFAAMDLQLERKYMRRALTPTDVRTAHSQGKSTVVQSVEGGHFLQGKIERVQEAYGRGLRHFGLLHDSDAPVPLGDVYTNPPVLGGLTAFGSSVIKECNRLGILVDLAHASVQTTQAALRVTTRPILISHTGLDTQLGSDERMARIMRSRLIGREQAKAVATAGGAIGVWTHLADTPTEYVQNIRAVFDVVGIDHVSIGTDTKLTAPTPRTSVHHPGRDRVRRMSGKLVPPGEQRPGPGPGRGRSGERTNEAWANEKAGFYYVVVEVMLEDRLRGTGDRKGGRGNFLRVFGEAVRA